MNAKDFASKTFVIGAALEAAAFFRRHVDVDIKVNGVGDVTFTIRIHVRGDALTPPWLPRPAPPDGRRRISAPCHGSRLRGHRADALARCSPRSRVTRRGADCHLTRAAGLPGC